MWREIKRLRGGHPEISNGMTHVCVCRMINEEGNAVGHCNKFLALNREPTAKSDDGSWKTIKAGEHLRVAKEHAGEGGSKAGGAVAKRITPCADVESESKMINFGSAMNAASTDDKTVSTAAPYSTAFFLRITSSPAARPSSRRRRRRWCTRSNSYRRARSMTRAPQM